ncbi:tetratricopeptide repeat protein [Mesorhizobium atlanticum]
MRTNEPAKGDYTAFGDTFDGLKTISDVDYYASDQAGNRRPRRSSVPRITATPGRCFIKPQGWRPMTALLGWVSPPHVTASAASTLPTCAYARAHRLLGATPEYYNNLGYSYLLRGKLQDARSNFLKAYELAPNDPTVANNLKLLSSSVRNIERS